MNEDYSHMPEVAALHSDFDERFLRQFVRGILRDRNLASQTDSRLAATTSGSPMHRTERAERRAVGVARPAAVRQEKTMIHAIKSLIAGSLSGLAFFGVISPTVVDNTTLIPVAAAIAVVLAVGGAVWKVGRFFKGLEDGLNKQDARLEHLELRQADTDKAVMRLMNGRNYEMDSLRSDLLTPRGDAEKRYHPSIVLIVDDDAADRYIAARKLKDAGFTILEADSMKEARTILTSGRTIDCVLMDLKLPDSNGAETIALFIREFPQAVCVAFSGSEDPQVKAAAIAAGAESFAEKAGTASPGYLPKMVAMAIERNKLNKQK